jgi:hypothetical protein
VKSIKIGPIRYKVSYVHDLRDDVGKLDGRISHTQAEIEVDDSMNEQTAAQTLLHEAVHAIELQTGIRLEEPQVDALAYSLFQLMRENPGLVKILRK